MDCSRQGEKEGLVYSAGARKKLNILTGAVPVALFFGIVLLALQLTDVYAPDGRGPIAATLVIGGFALAFVALFTTLPIAGLAIMRHFRKAVQAKCERLYLVNLLDANYVGFSPGDTLVNYDGDNSWDVGFLRLEADRLNYLGDRSSFSLSASQILGVRVESHGHFIWRFPRLFITWQREVGSQSQVLNLELREARSMKDLWQGTRSFQERMEGWWLERKGSSSSTANLFGLPPLPEETKPTTARRLPSYGWFLAFVLALVIPGVTEELKSRGYTRVVRLLAVVAIVAFVNLVGIGFRKLVRKGKS